MDTLSAKVKKSAFWIMVGRISSKVFALSSMVVLARILEVQDFGVVALANLSFAIILLFGEVGIGAYLIHNQQSNTGLRSSAFWLNVLVGLVLTLSTVLVAPLSAFFFENAIMKYIVMLLGVRFFLNSFGTVHYVLLTKELNIKKKEIALIVFDLLQYGLMIVFAVMGYGLWSLVIPGLLVSPLSVLVAWRLNPWRPRFCFQLEHVKAIWKYGRSMLGANFLGYLSVNGDYLLVGKFLGESALGIYSFSFEKASWPIANICDPISQIAFATFSKLQNNRLDFQKAYLKIIRTVTIVTYPILVALFSFTEIIIGVIFGDKWLPSVFLIQILIFSVVLRVVAFFSIPVMNAIGKPEKIVRFLVYWTPCKVGAIAMGLYLGGLDGVAWAICLSTLVGYYYLTKMGTTELSIPLLTVLHNIVPALSCSVLAGSMVFFSKSLLMGGNEKELLLFFELLVLFLLVYLSSLRFFFRSNWRETKNILIRKG